MKKQWIILLTALALIAFACYYTRKTEGFKLSAEEEAVCEEQCKITSGAYLLGGNDAYTACLQTCKNQYRQDKILKADFMKDIPKELLNPEHK